MEWMPCCHTVPTGVRREFREVLPLLFQVEKDCESHLALHSGVWRGRTHSFTKQPFFFCSDLGPGLNLMGN